MVTERERESNRGHPLTAAPIAVRMAHRWTCWRLCWPGGAGNGEERMAKKNPLTEGAKVIGAVFGSAESTARSAADAAEKAARTAAEAAQDGIERAKQGITQLNKTVSALEKDLKKLQKKIKKSFR